VVSKGIVIAGIGAGVLVSIVVMISLLNTGNDGNNDATESKGIDTDTRLRIATTFYPLYEFTSAVVKDKADVELFIPKGVEPHDWEPTTRDIERLRSFNVLIYNSSNFEPYIDNVREVLSNDLLMVEAAEGIIKNDDPHVWLDPLLAKEQVINIMNVIISIDKENEQYYKSNAESYIKRLEELHKEFEEGLSDCGLRRFIVLHAAYAYLAERYNLEIITVSGIEPEHDVSPRKIREVIDTAESYGIDVVYADEGIDSRIVEALAEEIGARVLILSPIEVVDEEHDSESESESDYMYIKRMRSNLENLREGLRCR